jgi:hypothetical protein
MKSFYSTSWMNHGHTGGGIGEVWRGAANGLARQSRWHLIPALLKDRDPRVRHAACMAMDWPGRRGGYRIPEDQLAHEMADLLLDNEWEYFTFDPPEKKLVENARTPRYREVAYPKGMENWFARDSDAKAAGWKKGKAPFANFDNKLPGAGPCANPRCGCGDPGKTLWDKEVLLMRRTFDLPPVKAGSRYCLPVGGASHVGVGDGYRVYINGKLLTEAKSYCGRGSGGEPDGAMITNDLFDDFRGGKVVVAATSFLRQHHRTHKIQGHINIWFQQMKLPPIPEAPEAE